MATHGIFIGVNKHSDPEIGELNGAARDAKALWALFTDTIDDLVGRLMIDAEATTSAVKATIIDTLANAGSDDEIIITFSGHGSPDGRLVLYDTVKADLSNTSILMSDLSAAFQTTSAKAVLFILDCCFSGQAPARVIELQATPRATFAFNGIHGEGRILLAACAETESAWEQTGTGHGILTYAVIKTLTTGEGTTISLASAIDTIVNSARVEAERIGVTQRPVFLGHITGGLTFPILKKGDNFYAAFPEIPERIFTGPFAELADVGIGQDIIDKWRERFPNGLNRLQLAAVNDHGVLQGQSLMIVAPTSSGKTMIGELGAIQAVMKGQKAAFLLPYRALVNEKYEEFKDRYASAGLRIVKCTGDSTDAIGPTLNGRYDIGFFTYETFLNMSLGSQRLRSQLGIIVLDEGQFITDPNRGIIVELILSMLIRSREEGIEPQLLVLSAVLGNLNNFDQWLGLRALKTTERPVPLIEGVLDRSGIYQFRDVDGSTKQSNLLDRASIVQRRSSPSSQDVIVPLVKKLVEDGEQVIVFRNQRGLTQGCAKYLADDLGLPAATSVIDSLPTHDLTSASRHLRDCLIGGTAFHNGNLQREERVAIERAFRNPEGGIRALAATTTLAAGVNTPASTVIIAEQQFNGITPQPYTVAEYKNMAGRAGRLGYSENGKSILLADNSMERTRLFNRYVLGNPEDVKSSFKSEQLSTWVIRLLSQIKEGIPRNEVVTLLLNTFGGYCASRANPTWAPNVRVDIERLIDRMLQTGLAELDQNILHLTLLGKACGASSLSFESSLRLVEIINRIDISSTPATHILAMVQVLQEADDIYTPMARGRAAEAIRVGQLTHRYGTPMAERLQRFARDDVAFQARCKRSAILWDWIHGVSSEVIEQQYSSNNWSNVAYGDITRIAEGTRFHLGSAKSIIIAIAPEQIAFHEQLEMVFERLENGLSEDALPLLLVNPNLTRGQILDLHRHGCRSIADVMSLSFDVLEATVGTTAAMLINPPPLTSGADSQFIESA